MVSQKQAQNDPEAPNTSTPTPGGVRSRHLVTRQSPGATGPQSFPCLVLSVPGSVGDLGRGGLSVKRTPKSLSSGGVQSKFVTGRGEQ